MRTRAGQEQTVVTNGTYAAPQMTVYRYYTDPPRKIRTRAPKPHGIKLKGTRDDA